MIIDTTKTKMDGDLAVANVMEQLKQVANDPNLTIVTGHSFSYVELTPEEKKWLLKNGPPF